MSAVPDADHNLAATGTARGPDTVRLNELLDIGGATRTNEGQNYCIEQRGPKQYRQYEDCEDVGDYSVRSQMEVGVHSLRPQR